MGEVSARMGVAYLHGSSGNPIRQNEINIALVVPSILVFPRQRRGIAHR
jgi:hypothetical protein